MSRLLAIAAAFLLSASAAQADDIRLVASAALKAAYGDAIPRFEAATGHRVAPEWSSSRVIHTRVLAGEAYDVVIIASILGEDLVQDLVRKGRIVPGSERVFAKSGIGVAVRAGAPKPDIGSADALRKALLDAKSVAYSAGASGAYIETMLKRLGVYDQVKARTVAVKPSEPVGDVVARGDAEIGFHQISELLPVKNIQIVGPLPAEVQNTTVYSGGIGAGARSAAAAKALVEFLSTPPVTTSLEKFGLQSN